MQFADTGTYKVKVTVNGCTSSETSAKVSLNPLPFVAILANPTDSVCSGEPVIFTAFPNNYGGTPAYKWFVNAQAKGTGNTFTTTSLNNGDIIRCDMTENTKCSQPYTDPSNDIKMTVLPWLAPVVSITASPSGPVKSGEYITFTAATTDAGNNPAYQWKRNGKDIVGATGSTWSANTLNDNDSISVEIMSNYKCPQPPAAVSNGIVVKVLSGINDHLQSGKLTLYPNPNTGHFILDGTLLTDTKMDIAIINAIGQKVYAGSITFLNGKLHTEIEMSEIAGGIYMLLLYAESGVESIRFRVK